MESSSKISTATSERPPKRLILDRRYGVIIDEWRDPSEEALDGARGMFCIVPLAKALYKKASNTIDYAGSFALKVLERPDLLSPETVQACLNDQLHKFTSVITKPQFNLLTLKGNSEIQSTYASSQLLREESSKLEHEC